MEFATFVRRVGANLRRARWAAGKTQEEVAVEALTFRLLGALERGRGNPTLRTLFLLARVLGVTVSELVAMQPTTAADDHASHDRAPKPPPRGRRRRATAAAAKSKRKSR